MLKDWPCTGIFQTWHLTSPLKADPLGFTPAVGRLAVSVNSYTHVYQYVMKVRFWSCSHVACDHALAISVCLSCKAKIFMAFYCVARKRPVKREKSKLQTFFRFAHFSRKELLLVSTQFKSKCSRFFLTLPPPPPFPAPIHCISLVWAPIMVLSVLIRSFPFCFFFVSCMYISFSLITPNE